MIRETLLQVLSKYGPSGHEHLGIIPFIRSQAEAFCDEIREDNMGNLICIRKGTSGGQTLLLMAHSDQIGLMVTDITEEGFLRVTPVGGVRTASLPGHIVVFENGTSGILSYESAVEYAAQEIPIKHVYIDIGAESKKEAEARAAVGDVAVFRPDTAVLSENRIAAPALDDRAGCAVLLSLLQLPRLPATLIAVFSTQEEIGLRGAAAAAAGLHADIALALDVTATGDTPNSVPLAIKLGAGTAVKVKDGHSISNVPLRKRLEKLAEENHIPFQREILPYGGTDCAAIQVSGTDIRAGALSIPCRYVHSAGEVIDLRDMEATLRLIEVLAQDMA